jgi:sulfite exporter TauE/SafE
MDILAAFTLGLLGSMHCIGMCGPLALAVPSSSQNRMRFFLERLVFNLGRLVTYALMGALLGLFGNRTILSGAQQHISILLGVSILLTVLVPFGLRHQLERFSPLKYLYTFVKTRFGKLLQKRGMATLLTMGLLNGLLPCGLVYTALLGATAVADAARSALFMTVFGVGTIPSLVAVAMSGKMISVKFRSFITGAIPVLSIALALLLILRGMNLGIPLVSPKVVHTETHQEKMDCCE